MLELIQLCRCFERVYNLVILTKNGPSVLIFPKSFVKNVKIYVFKRHILLYMYNLNSIPCLFPLYPFSKRILPYSRNCLQ